MEGEDENNLKFFQSYRKSTGLVYSFLKEFIKTNKTLTNYFYLCAVCICHVFNELYENEELKKKIFSVYLSTETKKSLFFSYEGLTSYLKNSSKETLVLLAKKIIDECINWWLTKQFIKGRDVILKCEFKQLY